MSGCKKIFFDEKGNRWFKVKLTVFFSIVTICLTSVALWPSFVRSSSPNAINCCGDRSTIDFPARLAYSGDLSNPTIIGEGHLERVMEIKEDYLVEPFTGEKRQINSNEKQSIQGKRFVIERYGNIEGKYVSLTFDDGPDPKYTPQILDILAKEKIRATFFITGENATKHPDLVKRIASEGHIVANHTFSHVDFDSYSPLRDRQEIVATDKIIRKLTGRQSIYFRLPYNGGITDEKSLKENVRGILHAQQLGFTITSFNVDSNDWDFGQRGNITIAPLEQKGNIVLLHDSGGDRSGSITYLEGLIKKAKTENYSFLSLSDLSEKTESYFYPTKTNLMDRIVFLGSQAFIVLPDYLMYILFIIAAVNIVIFTLINLVLALFNKRKIKKLTKCNTSYNPFVSVVIAAYNEDLVIEKTIESIIHSSTKNLEIIVVDDGSTDDTNKVLKKLHNKYKVLKYYTQKNSGKSEALNYGITKARGEIIITADADTVFLTHTIEKLTRHFHNKRVGAVAGFVKVGNMSNLLTCWQSMEYVAGISLERFAHAYFGTIMITPGACGAWRKKAILEAGGYSSETLAEDCDLTLMIQKIGYKAVTDLEAKALTEAPKTISDFLKQRLRWMFGNLQVFWKHKDMIFNPRYGFLGLYIIPQAVFAVLLQLLFMPFTYLMTLDHFLAGEADLVLTYFLALMIFQFFISLFALWLSKEKYANLIIVPTYRLIAEPLRAFLLYSSFLSILKGRMVSWNKVRRLGEVNTGPPKQDPLTATS